MSSPTTCPTCGTTETTLDAALSLFKQAKRGSYRGVAWHNEIRDGLRILAAAGVIRLEDDE